MKFLGLCGDSFVIQEPNSPKQHLYVLLSTPSGNPKKAVAVNVTSNAADTTVSLHKGDHPYIVKTCYVNFKDAKEISIEPLKKAIEKGMSFAQPHFDANVLLRIQEGALRSEFTPNNIKKLLQK
jgi:hypothetical protein